jgi:uncharacterized membrane protein YjgN (DUF898 family)
MIDAPDIPLGLNRPRSAADSSLSRTVNRPANTPAPKNTARRRSTANTLPEGAQQFEFTGTGREYFRIWIVNLLLTIITLGIYSAWAKVRRLQYFYRNTQVGGSTFDYHGDPRAILKGRIFALVLVSAYKIAGGISGAAALAIGAILVALMPWMLARSFRFKLVNSSYRGLRFRFHGSVGDAYRSLSLFPVMLGVIAFFIWSVFTSFARSRSIGTGMTLTLVALALVSLAVVPMAHFSLKRYQRDNAYFGQTPVFFHATARDFFRIYGRTLGVLAAGVFIAMLTGFSLFKMLPGQNVQTYATIAGLLSALNFYALCFLVQAFLDSRLQNHIWQQTEMGGIRFQSRARARTLFWIQLSNLILVVLTLGLFKPFATVRLLKYRIENLVLIPDEGLEEFLADQSSNDASAAGQEAGDFFDFDFAL